MPTRYRREDGRVFSPFPPKKPIKASIETEALPSEIATQYFKPLLMAESNNQHVDPKTGKLIKSHKGALGIAQVMPATARSPGYGVRPLKNDTEEEHKRFAFDYLTAMVKEFKGDVNKALAAYNAGVGTVKKAVDQAGEGGDWMQYLPVPEETIPYINKITGSQFEIVKKRKKNAKER